MDTISFTTATVGPDTNGDGIPDNDQDQNANTVRSTDLVSSGDPTLERVLGIVGNGDTVLGAGEAGFVLSKRGTGARATTLEADNTAADPVLIRGNGIVSGTTFGDLTRDVRYSKTAGFGLDNGPDTETPAKVLNNGDALTFEVTGGRLLRAVEFVADAAGTATSSRVAFDFGDETLGDGEFFALTAADNARIRVDFVAAAITVNGAAVTAPAGFFAAFAGTAQTKLTIGSPLGDAGFAVVDLRLSAEVPPNVPPVVATPLADQAAIEDAAFGFVVPAGAFADPEGGAFVLTATLASGAALPSWLTFDAATRTFSGTPLNGDVGAIDVRVTATDPDGASVSDLFALTVANTNDAPTVATPLADRSFSVAETFSFAIPAAAFVDQDAGDTLSYAATLEGGAARPAWLMFDAATRTFSGAPPSGAAGVFAVQVTATDVAGASVSDVFSFAVTDGNAPPVLATPLPDQPATEDTAFSYTVPAGAFTDADLDTLTLSATLQGGGPLPAWLAFDAATATFSGTPANGDVGVLQIAVTATDPDGARASDVFALTIANTNDAPTLAAPLADRSAGTGEAFVYIVPAGSFVDPDVGDVLTYAARLDGGGDLPTWLSFDAATRTFAGTPALADVGAISVQVTATDSAGAAVSDSFALSVTQTNNAPTVVTPPTNAAGRAGEAFFHRTPPSLFSDTDPGDTLTLSATLANGAALPDWLTFDAATGRFAGLPDAAGVFQIRLTATDASGAAVSADFSLDVGAGRLIYARDFGAFGNDAQDDTAAIQSAVNAAAAAGGGTVILGHGTFLVTGTDDKSDGAIRLLSNTSLRGQGAGDTVLKVADGWAGDITGVVRTPFNEIAENVGLFDLTIDGNRANTTGKIDGFYSGVAPGDPRRSEDHIVQRVELKNNSGYGFDPHEITVGLFALDNTAHHNSLDGFVADYIVEGLYKGNVSYANDRHGFNVTTTSQSLRLVDNIAYGNASAGFVVQRGSENIAFPFGIEIEGGSSFGNAREGVLVRMANDIAIRDVLIEDNGLQGIRVRGGDDVEIVGNTLRNNARTALVDQVNIQAEDDTLTSGQVFVSADVLVAQNRIVSDAANPPRFGVRGEFDGSNAITVIDNRVLGFLSGAVSVLGPNNLVQGTNTAPDAAPVAAVTLLSTTATEDQAFAFTLPAQVFTDANGDAVTLTARLSSGAPLPAWLSFDATTGRFSGTPGDGDEGVLDVAVVGTDPTGLAGRSTFTVTVTGINDAPALVNPIPDRVAVVGTPIVIQAPSDTFRDADGGGAPGVTVTLAGGAPLPSWLVYNAATYTLSGTPPLGSQAQLNVQITATDAAGATATDIFALTVVDTNTAPVLNTPLPDGTGRAGQAFFYKVPAGAITDVNTATGDVLTYSATLANGAALPSWLVLDAARGSFAGLPPTTGSLSVIVTAQDKVGAKVSDTVALTFTAARVFDVRDYGARSNDGIDDRAALQRAIDAATAAGGGTVQLSAGTYTLTGGAEGSDGALILRDNVTLRGAGIGQTILKVQDGWSGDITGILRTEFDVVTKNIGVFDLTIDGNQANTTGAIDAFFTGVDPDDPRQSENVIVQRVEMRENSRYGFDPHEQTANLFALDNIAHHNGLDGFVADYIVGGLYQSNISYSNVRHGFNVVTQTTNVGFIGNHAYNNGGTGVVVQRGSEDRPGSSFIRIEGGSAIGNRLEGYLVKLSEFVSIDNVLSENNGTRGIRVQGSEHVTVTNNLVRNNSQTTNAFYDQIQIEDQVDIDFDRTFLSSDVLIQGNRIVAAGAVLPRYGVRVDPDGTDFVTVADNRIVGFTTGATSIAGANSTVVRTDTSPDQAPVAVGSLGAVTTNEDALFTRVLPAGLFSDPDPNNALTLTARLQNGGPLPAWLRFDAATRTLSGTPANLDVGALAIAIVATDSAGLSARLDFTLTVANVNDAPQLAHGQTDRIAPAGALFSLDMSKGVFIDQDAGDTLAYSATLSSGAALPAWLTINAQTGILSGTPTNANAGAITVRVFARDAAGARASDDIVIQVSTNAAITGTPGNDTLNGTANADTMYGLAGNDTLRGNGGNDLLDGGTGTDRLEGGAGNDTYLVDATADVVVESSNQGFDIVIATANYTLPGNVEELRLEGAALNGTGNSSANTIVGNALDNALSGGSGADTMRGGAGSDSYIVNSSDDVVVELAGEGVDTIRTTVNLTLATNVENGIIDGTSRTNLTGNDLANALTGNRENNKLVGGAGNDVLDGKAGADELTGGTGADTFVLRLGEARNDKIISFEGANAVGGDVISFVGFGANVTLTNNRDIWTVTGSLGSAKFEIDNITALSPDDWIIGGG